MKESQNKFEHKPTGHFGVIYTTFTDQETNTFKKKHHTNRNTSNHHATIEAKYPDTFASHKLSLSPLGPPVGWSSAGIGTKGGGVKDANDSATNRPHGEANLERLGESGRSS